MRKSAPGYFLIIVLLATVLACSSNEQKDESVSADVAEATSDVPPADGGLALEGGAAPADQPAPGGPETAESEMAAPEMPADPNGAAPVDAAAAPPAPAEGGGDMALADPNGAPTLDAAAPPPAENGPPPPASDSFAGADTGAGSSDLFGTGAADAGGEAPKPKKAKLSHIKDVPFKKGGQLLNTVYIAREGDTLEIVSQKLFGADKTADLKKANPHLKKSVKTGDKVYFNSPNRTEDKDRLLTVYEDQGLPPSIYTTKEGDTLKSLATEWYGAESSYKEIFAINRNLASPQDLPPGTEIQYWPATAAVTAYANPGGADVAQAQPVTQEAPPPTADLPPPPAPGNQLPPSGMDTANNNNPPPGMGTTEPVLPPPPNMPPPPSMDSAPPPIVSSPKKRRDVTAAMDKDTIMYAAVGGVCLIGFGLLIAIRRRNARRSSGITQV